MQIRLAVPEDASAILGIYMHYCLEPMTFELESPTLSEIGAMPTNKSHQAIKIYLNELQKIVSCVATEVCYVYPNNSGRQVLA